MINKIEVSVDIIIHATEDASKFLDIFEKEFCLEKEKFSLQNLVGHFDNPIILLSLKLRKKEGKIFVEKIVKKMPNEQINQIIENIEGWVESSTLYLRFDKQKFIQGEISLQEKNAIKVKIFTPIYNKKETSETFGKLLSFSN